MKKIVIIPIYKSIPDRSETMSFSQCLNVLFNHPLCLITYRSLDISFYTNLIRKVEIVYKVEYFDKIYFENLVGYNKLMLSVEFYTRFKDFEYILLYQLDAWVFRDELDYWCQKGYDYIGAPWFEGWHEANIEAPIIGVGNGGFSLRKVKQTKQLIKKMKLMNVLFRVFNIMIKLLPILMENKRIVRTENFLKSIAPGQKNEDYQIMVLSQIFKGFNIAPTSVALSFSFDTNPGKLFEMNNNQLPFGCHAWIRYENDFWRKYIK